MAFIKDTINFLKFEAQNWWSACTWTENSIPDLRCVFEHIAFLCNITNKASSEQLPMLAGQAGVTARCPQRELPSGLHMHLDGVCGTQPSMCFC